MAHDDDEEFFARHPDRIYFEEEAVKFFDPEAGGVSSFQSTAGRRVYSHRRPVRVYLPDAVADARRRGRSCTAHGARQAAHAESDQPVGVSAIGRCGTCGTSETEPRRPRQAGQHRRRHRRGHARRHEEASEIRQIFDDIQSAHKKERKFQARLEIAPAGDKMGAQKALLKRARAIVEISLAIRRVPWGREQVA